ncbi:lysozyme inhibitor LprI family protein [Paracoccaceae bacterium Fryx2]|nr:lysozyme inhibitor LprI family protein [Paracoccaceae bacterium Fryx2]
MLLISLALPGAGLAQTSPSPEPTAACVAAATTEAGREACIGLAAAACLGAVKGAAEVDAAICLNAETVWWADRLRAARTAMTAKAEALDEAHAAQIAKGAAKMADDFANFQTAWSVWSEQRCTFEAMLHFGKPDRMVAASTCLLQVTAEQALLLEAAAR